MPTKRTTARHAPTDQRPTCCHCGGHNVETNAWIEYRPDGTAAVVNSEGPIFDASGNWCRDCDDHHPIEYPETTPADDARRQAAEAVREAGPELAAALAALVRLARITAGPIDHRSRAYREAVAVLDRLAIRTN